MKIQFNTDRTRLTITVDAGERRELAELGDAIHSDNSMVDWLEPITCDSDLDWVRPENVGDFTSAPMLGIRFYDNESQKETVLERFAFMDYQVCSLLERLRDAGQAVLFGGQI